MAEPVAVNVNITLESTDLTTDALSIVNYADVTPITMGGILRRMALKVTGVDHEELVEENHYEEGAVVYVYNPSTDTAATGNISLEIGGKIIMVLGAGDWALFPWSAGQSGDDINVSGGTAGNLVEYGVFGKPA